MSNRSRAVILKRLAFELSELENLRERVRKAEQKRFGAARRRRSNGKVSRVRRLLSVRCPL
jgi:hypothetical protein